MKLQIKISKDFFHLLPFCIFCLCLLSGCRHTVPVLQKETVVLDAYTENQSSYSLSCDPAGKKVMFFRNDYIRIREKVTYNDAGKRSRENKWLLCTDFWMKYSLWSGEPRKNTEYLAIFPLTLYPVIDTCILVCCLTGDIIMYPITYITGQKKNTDPIVISESDDKKMPQEVLAHIKINDHLFYRDVIKNKISRKLEMYPVSVYDSGKEKVIFTDKTGAVDFAKLISRPLPERKVHISISKNINIRNNQLFLDTRELLTAAQKKNLSILRDPAADIKMRKEALQKLKNIYKPERFAAEKSILDLQMGK